MDQVDSASSVVAMETLECVDALSAAEMSSSAYMSDGFSTPSYSRCIPFCESSCTPECDENVKPTEGMVFPMLEGAEEFYRLYALNVGFDVRTGQSRKVADRVVWKRLYCSKEGERSSDKQQARVTEKRTNDNRYIISEFIERHAHALVTPSKKMFMKANRKVSGRAKNALLTCHKMHRCLLRIYIARKQRANPGFFFEYVLDDEKRLVCVFWSDATSRKNYAHFGDVVSFDSIYKTNQYDMIFAPFTGVNHHKACVMFGAAFISNEKIESYKWVFETFLKAMGGKAPKLIITDEDASMKVAISSVLPSTKHRFCMWHIMRKLPDKVTPTLRDNERFYKQVNSCLWGSETPDEFEAKWSSLISDFELEDNEWLDTKYRIRDSWVPAYCRDVCLAGILRTTSRSESQNNFFRHFIGYKYALVEFWLRFATAMEEQRHQELEADNANMHSTPQLQTPWELEKNGNETFTIKVFSSFQKEVLAARDHCFVENTYHDGEVKIMEISDDSSKMREVRFNTVSMIANCSCMLLELYGIPCRHIIHVLRGVKLKELLSYYVQKRWTKWCKREAMFDTDGNLLEEKSICSEDSEMHEMVSSARNDMEESIILAAQSTKIMELVRTSLANLLISVKQMVPMHQQSRQGEIEAFIGCSIPDQIDIHAPGDIDAKGRRKRYKGHAEKGAEKDHIAKKKKETNPRLCGFCKQIAFHDKRNCPNKEN